MASLSPERVLLIGDPQRQVQAALSQALPNARVTPVATYFDGIAALSADVYTAVLAAAEPIERRPEAAVRTLRELAGDGRLVLFGQPSLELLSRKMLQFGCDDYIVTPANPAELQQLFGTPAVRLNPAPPAAEAVAGSEQSDAPAPAAAEPAAAIAHLPIADVLLDAQLHHPQDPVAAALKQINTQLGAGRELFFRRATAAGARPPDGPTPREGQVILPHPVRAGGHEVGTLHLALPRDEDETAARHVLGQLALLVGKLSALHDRHRQLERLAITDELTGVYNARFFRQWLSRIIEKARQRRFPVTLLLFDIDDFKKYNDRFGHAAGDEILRQTAKLMKECTRKQDLVARIGGDEFAVVFWDTAGPRQPKHGHPGAPSLPPQTPEQVYARFKRRIESEQFPSLGSSGQGLLGISAGLAVFPYDAHDATTLVEEADRRLMMGAKKSGKNTLFIVGPDEPNHDEGDEPT